MQMMMKTSGDIEARNKLLSLRNEYLMHALIWLLARRCRRDCRRRRRPHPQVPSNTTPGIVVLILTLVAPLAVAILNRYIKHRPVNRVLIMLLCVLMPFALGLSCSSPYMGKYLWLNCILGSVVFVTLTLYTFLAAVRGHDFSFLRPFLMVSLFVLIVFAFIQIFIADDKWVTSILAPLTMIILAVYIIYYDSN